MKKLFLWALPALVCASLACRAVMGAQPAPIPTLATPVSVEAARVEVYDPARDPALDLQRAVTAASASNKRVLVEVGGDWCIWCHHMDDFYAQHPALLALREQSYILVKVNYSDENRNAAFLDNYPSIPGYPHIFIFDGDGRLIQSQDTSALEKGESYDLDKFTAFLEKWKKQ